MFNKKKFRLVENKNKMFYLKISPVPFNFNWRNCLVTFGLTVFALLLIFGNFKSQSYYAKLKAAKQESLQNDSENRSIQVFKSFDEKSFTCQTKICTVTCSGDVKNLNNYLNSQKNCSFITLRISDAIFPEDELKSNWLEGSFQLNSIKISLSVISGIQDGAFDQQTVAHISELELNDVQLPHLTEKTFQGLNGIETFTLVNRMEHFSGKSFLKPMMKTLKKLVIKHVTSTATNPGPWLRGESFPNLMTIVFDGSNFGGYINAATFEHLKKLSIMMMNSCQISKIADGSFDFMMNQMVVLISLQNNQLKQLDGEYLSKINSLRRLDIQNNPWECTCELEHLARVFKDYPEGFGENSKCSSPPDHAGKLLNESTLKECEDEPPVPLETSTSAVKPSTGKDSTALTSSIAPTITTTTPSAESIFIECARHSVRFRNYPQNILELSPPDGNFEIISISETGIRLIFEDPSDDLSVIWFYEQPSLNQNYGNIRIVGEFDVGCQSELETLLVVEGLVVNKSYTFCLVKNGEKVISPFNCKSHFSSVENYHVHDAIWLRTKDRPLAIGVFVASIVVSIFVGLIGMLVLIRFYPCFVRSITKRIQIDNKTPGVDQRNIRNSTAVYSLRNSLNPEATTAHIRRFSTESGLSYMLANNYEELEYYRRMNVHNDLKFSNRVPRSPAPPLPKRISGIVNKKVETLNISNVHVMEHKCNDYGYTSVV